MVADDDGMEAITPRAWRRAETSLNHIAIVARARMAGIAATKHVRSRGARAAASSPRHRHHRRKRVGALSNSKTCCGNRKHGKHQLIGVAAGASGIKPSSWHRRHQTHAASWFSALRATPAAYSHTARRAILRRTA